MTLIEKYQRLSTGKQALIRRQFINLFGTRRTFYNKINELVRVRPVERNWLEEKLNPSTNDNTNQ